MYVASLEPMNRLRCLALEDMEIAQLSGNDPGAKQVFGNVTLPGGHTQANLPLVMMHQHQGMSMTTQP